jgi:hypothetical protein
MPFQKVTAKHAPPMRANDLPVVAQAVPPANSAHIGAATVGSCEKMRPQAGVDRLKPVPPMRANGLPVVGQALSPANRILSHFLKERFL